jgi:hypothetical protein
LSGYLATWLPGYLAAAQLLLQRLPSFSSCCPNWLHCRRRKSQRGVDEAKAVALKLLAGRGHSRKEVGSPLGLLLSLLSCGPCLLPAAEEYACRHALLCSAMSPSSPIPLPNPSPPQHVTPRLAAEDQAAGAGARAARCARRARPPGARWPAERHGIRRNLCTLQVAAVQVGSSAHRAGVPGCGCAHLPAQAWQPPSRHLLPLLPLGGGALPQTLPPLLASCSR